MAYVIGISSKIEFQRASSSDSIRSHSKKTSFLSPKTPCLIRQLPDGQGVFVLFLNCSGTRVACEIFLSAAGTAASTTVVARVSRARMNFFSQLAPGVAMLFALQAAASTARNSQPLERRRIGSSSKVRYQIG